MPNRRIYIFGAFALFLIVAVFFAYKNYNQNRGVERGYSNEKVVESQDALSTGFPQFPVYPGLKLDKSYRREQDGKVDFSAFWYHDFEEEKIPEVMKWYIDEFKKAGWKVEGPIIDESEGELGIIAENNEYKVRLYNSERYEGGSAGPAGKIIAASVYEK